MLWTFEVSIASASVMSGKMEGNRRAISDLPKPGGLIRRTFGTLCLLYLQPASHADKHRVNHERYATTSG
jgi:hypothetical protein